MADSFAEGLEGSPISTEIRDVNVLVSYDVVKLFSEQLYTTPVKAIEELVVNSWDADARHCSVLVDTDSAAPVIAVYDDGNGMTVDELENLWHIGVSSKSGIRADRRQIGKFGIGKLASYAVARRATYVSKSNGDIHSVAIDFEDFAAATDADGVPSPVTLKIRKIQGTAELLGELAAKGFDRVLSVTESEGEAPVSLSLDDESWTLVILEDLKEKAAQLRLGGRLRWVLQTAMPFASDFQLFLNSAKVDSSKQQIEKLVTLNLKDIDERRLADLSAEYRETWERSEEGVVSPSFPSGITGEAYVTERSLYAQGGKSEDLGRSHGFFVRVQNRLINETDPLFGARPLSFGTFYKFAAVVNADDLNPYVTAARDDVEQSDMKAKLRSLLVAIFYQARDLAKDAQEVALKEARVNKEGQLDYVSTSLVERPLADALAEAAEISYFQSSTNEEPNEFKPTSLDTSWRYLRPVDDVEAVQRLVEQLYTDKRSEKRYSFRYTQAGADRPLVSLDATNAVFFINDDHEFATEFGEAGESRRALEVVAAAEAMLEVYMRETHLSNAVIQHVLDRHDLLLRSLAKDQGISLKSLAAGLRDASTNAVALEIAMVGALRALGFAARHIGGPGTPDGLANYLVHGTGKSSFTLEAKSSKDQPSLGHLDFAGLKSHYVKSGATGCILVAPGYPGEGDDASEVSLRANQQGVSCWTIDQLARVVESAESRHINASDLQDIVLNAFDPVAVSAAVESLLGSPTFSQKQLYIAIVKALKDLQPRLRDATRNVSMISAEVSREPEFNGIEVAQVDRATGDLARASRGMLNLADDGSIQVLGDLDELSRRVAHLTGEDLEPRRLGSFRTNGEVTPE